jgi:hypothetical protein
MIKARPKPGFVVAVTPSTPSWYEFAGFIEEWERLRTIAA